LGDLTCIFKDFDDFSKKKQFFSTSNLSLNIVS